ncbi:MAG: hypothetical protein S4CHLAM20_06210 [Chlamydiia bacterium]|nr:hypothetical protein [Chlamydiia bacterium]
MELASLLKNSLPLIIILLSSVQMQPSPVVPHQTKASKKNDNTLIGQTLMSTELQQASAHHAQVKSPNMPSSNDIMIVDPKEMAKDWKQAFTTLKSKQNQGLLFKLANGEKVKDISNIDTLPGGYLMIFTVKNLHGLQYKIIKTSEILSLETE